MSQSVPILTALFKELSSSQVAYQHRCDKHPFTDRIPSIVFLNVLSLRISNDFVKIVDFAH